MAKKKRKRAKAPRSSAAAPRTKPHARPKPAAEKAKRPDARSSTYRRVGMLVIAAALVGGYLLLTRPPSPQPSTPFGRRLLNEAPNAAKAAGCGPVRTVAPFRAAPSADRNHIGYGGQVQPPLSDYTTHPPASGPHDPIPLNAGVYRSPPNVFMAIHSLEHGAVEIWYAPSAASDPAMKAITAFFGQSVNQDHLIVAPYDYPNEGVAARLEPGVQMALVSWHRIQTCARPSLAAAYAFAARYRYPPVAGQTYLGDAPEKGLGI